VRAKPHSAFNKP